MKSKHFLILTFIVLVFTIPRAEIVTLEKSFNVGNEVEPILNGYRITIPTIEVNEYIYDTNYTPLIISGTINLPNKYSIPTPVKTLTFNDINGVFLPNIEVLDSTIYTINSFFKTDTILNKDSVTKYFNGKSIIRNINTFKFNQNIIGKVELNLVKYNHNSRTIVIYNKLQITTDPVASVYINSFQFLSSNAIYETTSSTTDKLLIVTVDEYIEAAWKLAKWKRRMGYDVFIETKSNWIQDLIIHEGESRDKAGYLFSEEDIRVLNNSTSNSILRSKIKEYYLVNKITDVLLLGGINNISSFKGCTAPSVGIDLEGGFYTTDLYYTNFDVYSNMNRTEPIFSKLNIGRIPGDNINEINNSIDKILYYEQTPNNNYSFYKNLTVSAHLYELERAFAETAYNFAYNFKEDKRRQFVFHSDGNTMSPVPYKTKEGLKFYTKDEPNWNSHLKTLINTGTHILLNRSHGNTGAWTGDNENFNLASVITLNNYQKYPFIFSINCNTGSLEINGLDKKFITSKDKGSIGSVSCSGTSSHFMNNVLSHSLAFYLNPQPIYQENNYIDFHEDNTYLASGKPIYKVGELLRKALFLTRTTTPEDYYKIYNTDTEQSPFVARDPRRGTKYYPRSFFDQYSLFGDPTMRLWLNNPHYNPITVTHESTLNPDNQYFPITSNIFSDDTKAVLTQNNRIVGWSFGDNIALNRQVPIWGKVELDITSPDMLPYSTILDVENENIEIGALTISKFYKNFAIYSRNKTRVNDYVEVFTENMQSYSIVGSGNYSANSYTNIGVGARVGEVFSRGDIRLRSKSRVYYSAGATGDIVTQLPIYSQGIVDDNIEKEKMGWLNYGINVTKLPINNSNKVINSENNASTTGPYLHEFSPNVSYGNVIVNSYAKSGVTKGGVYYFNNLIINGDAGFEFLLEDNDNRPVVIFIKENLTIGDDVSMFTTIDESRIIFIVGGNEVNIGHETDFVGTVVAPYALVDVKCGSESEIIGAFYGYNTTIHQYSNLVHKSFEYASLLNITDWSDDKVETFDYVSEISDLKISPNPVSDAAEVLFDIVSNAKIIEKEIKFLVINTSTLETQKIISAQNLSVGRNSVDLKDSHQYPVGTYIIHMYVDGQLITSYPFEKVINN